MTRTYIRMDSQVNDLILLARKAKVIVEDLEQDYFGEDIKTPDDFWKLAGSYYESAGLKAGIVNGFLYDMINELGKLQTLINDEEGDVI